MSEHNESPNNDNSVRDFAMLDVCKIKMTQLCLKDIISTISRLILRVRVTGTTCADRPLLGVPRLPTVRQGNVTRQRHLRDTFLKAESKRHFVWFPTCAYRWEHQLHMLSGLKAADPTVVRSRQQRFYEAVIIRRIV